MLQKQRKLKLILVMI